LASAEAVAHDFWSALCKGDRERAISLLAEDAVFHPAGLPLASGGEAIETYLAEKDESITSVVETIARYDDMIILERVDPLVGDLSGRLRVILSLVRIEHGRITSWQDFVAPPQGRALTDPPRWSPRWARAARRASAP